jgi:hypothetical protein
MADSGEAGDEVKKHDGVIIVNLRKSVNGHLKPKLKIRGEIVQFAVWFPEHPKATE